MPYVLLDDAPPDSAQKLSELAGAELLSFVQSLSWDGFLASYLVTLGAADLKSLLDRLIVPLPPAVAIGIIVPVGNSGAEEFIEEIRTIYVYGTGPGVSASEIIANVARAWSARADDASGRHLVAASLNIIFVKEQPHKASLSISKALDGLGLFCEELRTPAGNACRFFTSSLRAPQAVKRLLAFWGGCVPEHSVPGFIGRVYELELPSRLTAFGETWDKEVLRDLDSQEARELASFLSSDGAPVSPSAASCRRFLAGLLSMSAPDAQLEAVEKEAEAGAQDDVILMEPPRPRSDLARAPSRSKTGSKATPKAKQKQKVKTVSRASSPAQSARRAAASGGFASEDDSETEGSFSTTDSEPSDSRPGVAGSPKFVGLPRKMVQVLAQGGPDFEDLFEPLRIDVTTTKDLQKLLRYFNDSTRVTREICRASGLSEDTAECQEYLEVGRIAQIRPDHRLADTLSFSQTARKAPRILHRWMSHGSIMPWLTALAAKAGQVEKDSADGYLAREIMSAGLTLASLLNEFHPAQMIYSNAIERLVRRLWVIEKCLAMERADRGAYVVKMLGFIGIGSGPVLSPEELN